MRKENTPFDHTMYMPVLRCKDAEKKALAELDFAVRGKMTPLIEVPRALRVKNANPKKPDKLLARDDPRVPMVLDQLLRKVSLSMKQAWHSRQLLLDLQHLHPEWRTPDGLHPVTACWNYASEDSLFPPNPIPVVTLSSDFEFCQAVKGVLEIDNVGIGIRVNREQLGDSNLQSHLMAMLQKFALSPTQVDLIADFGLVEKDELRLAWICSRIPWIQKWRTYSCISGSFRKDLAGLDVGEYEFERWEWQSYRDQISGGDSLQRVPTYGDYATQCAAYAEPVDGPRPSASLRYTADEKFIVVRGRALHLGAKYLQYPANAMSLCSRPEFRTITSCAGDDYIADKAANMIEIERTGKGTGNPQTWIQASLNRHWTVAAHQISTLFAP